MITTKSQEGLPQRRPLNSQTRAVLLIVCAAMGLHAMGMGGPPAATGLDASWTAVLGWAASRNIQFGHDLVFTYGPLGFLYPNAAYIGEAFGLFLAGQLVLGALLAVSLYALLTRLNAPQRMAYCAVGLVCVPWLAADPLWLLFLAQNMVTLTLVASAAAEKGSGPGGSGSGSGSQLALSALFGGGAAALALVKFTLLPVALITVMAACTALALAGRRGAATSHGLGFGLGILGLWLVCGQPFSGLASYAASSVEIATGYGSAMGLVPSPWVDLLGFLSMAATGGWLGWQAIAQRRRVATALTLFALGCVAFVSWRLGFTRADAHIHQTFPLMAMLPLLGLALLNRTDRWVGWVAMSAALLALLVGLILARSQLAADRWLQALDRMPQVIETYAGADSVAAQRELVADHFRQAHPLSRIRAQVGDASVDLINWEQGVVLLHGLNYQPRPVFQSYSAYTPDLLRRNEAHFLRPDGPRFVLLKLQAIDGRLPAGEDALALLALLRGYVPVLEEAGFLLFERTAENSIEPFPRIELDRDGTLGDWIDLPSGAPAVLAVEANPSLLGRAYSFWFRTPPLMIELETRSGSLVRYRIQPRAAAEGLLIDPLLRGTDQLANIYLGRSMERVVRFRLMPDRPWQLAMWKHGFRHATQSFQWRRPDAEQQQALRSDTDRASFNIHDSLRQGTIQSVTESGREVLFMHSPAILEFQIAPGQYTVALEFGVQDAAVRSADCAAASADGVRIRLDARIEGSAWQELVSADIDPWKQPAQAGPNSLQSAFAIPSQGWLRLAMEAGPPGAQSACDWGWVHGLRLSRVVEARQGGR